MPSSSKKGTIKASRANNSRKRKADDNDNNAQAIAPEVKANSSTAIIPHEAKVQTELDSRPFQYAQLHAESARSLSHGEKTRRPERMANSSSSSSSSDNHTAAPGTSHPTPTSSSSSLSTSKKTIQGQTSIPERHQTLRDLFRSTRAHQTQSLPESQHGSMTEPRSARPDLQTPNTSTPAAEPTEELLKEIDLRCPTDDPEYDFISSNEAVHSSRNAQPDHASKYTTAKRPPSSSATSSARRRTSSDDSDEEEESDGESTSWRSYDFVKESEAKFSARNASSDHASKYPELRGGNRAGGEGERKGGKGWVKGWLI